MSDSDTTETEIDIDTSIRMEALSLAAQLAQPSVGDNGDDFEPEPAIITIERAKRFESYIRGQG
jgi:hypothetical protein